MSDEKPSMALFWGCFIALVTTSFAFSTRAYMVNAPGLWPSDFGLDNVQAQELFGAGIWPFAISIILFSLVIDKIGYRAAMYFSFVCYAIYTVLALSAYAMVKQEGLSGAELEAAQGTAFNMLYGGSVVLALGNGTVEAFINPVVATMFSREKTKWLNILHAGWPGGLVLGGILTLAVSKIAGDDWRIIIWLIAIPAVVYLVMLVKAKFPVDERVASGTTYREMLAEFGAIGALIAFSLVLMQIGRVFSLSDGLVWGLVAVSVIAYGLYCRSLGRPILIFLCLIMMPLAATELGTDGAIKGLMEVPMKEAGFDALWVLIYTSAIMMVLRFFAGPVVHVLSPLGLLAVASAIAIGGLFWLSSASGLLIIFIAATVYGVGKTYFWPTMLGVVSEQCPKGGALTINAIAGIGMLTVGILASPLIGSMQESSARDAIAESGEVEYENVSESREWLLGEYTAVADGKVAELPEEKQEKVNAMTQEARQSALAKVTIFPMIMLVCYILLILYFRSKGGYRAEVLTGHGAEDGKFTGGVEGAADA